MKMKRIAALAAAGMLACAPAMADVDLSGMSFDELVAMKEQVTRQIMMTDQWQQVTVPAGVYQIGKEIPAGKWTISPTKGKWFWVYLGTELNKSHTDFTSRGRVDGHYLGSSYGVQSWTWDLMDGYYIILNGPSVFTRYTGPSFSFK